jgi:hypothetical protein
MGYRKQDRFQKIPKSQRAKQFEEGLLDQMRFEPEINNLWIKYRFDITLPVNDNERVEFNRDDSTGDFKKLKDFILSYEENWMLE